MNGIRSHFIGGLLALAAVRAEAAEDTVKRIVLPPETALFQPGPGVELANALCLTCHSVEYVSLQPRLTRDAWKGVVDKMVTRFGATVPPDSAIAITAYLEQTYSKGVSSKKD